MKFISSFSTTPLASAEKNTTKFDHLIDLLKMNPMGSMTIENKISAVVLFILSGDGEIKGHNLKARQIVYIPGGQLFQITSGSTGLEFLRITTSHPSSEIETQLFVKEMNDPENFKFKNEEHFFLRNLLHPSDNKEKPAIPYCMGDTEIQPGCSADPNKDWPMSSFHYVIQGEGILLGSQGEERERVKSGEHFFIEPNQTWQLTCTSMVPLKFISVLNECWKGE